MGFQVYISNNLPSGNLSAIAPAAGNGIIGGLSGANASGTTPGRATYFGRKGTIDVVMQKAPALEIRKKDDTKMDRIHAVLHCNRHDKRHDNNRRKNLHHHSDSEQKDVQNNQEKFFPEQDK